MRHLSDKDLLTLLRNGDHAAFQAIYERYASSLIQFGYSKTGDADDAKDCVQEVFIWIWQSAATLPDISFLEAYLKTAVRNKLINLIDKKLRREDYSKEAIIEVVSAMPADVRLNYKELSTLLQHEINAMPVKMRAIFELSRKDGLSPKQIAGKLSLSEQTVKNQIGNAKQRLRERLNGYLGSWLL